MFDACGSGGVKAIKELLEPILALIPLVAACEKGSIDLVKLLIDLDVDLNESNKRGETALTNASRDGEIEIARMLVKAGANLNTAETKGRRVSPLGKASSRGHCEMVQFLAASGADTNQTSGMGRTPLSMACHRGYIAIVSTLIGAGATLESVILTGDHSGEFSDSPLVTACRMGHYHIVRLLLKAGADVNRVDFDDRTALWIACHDNNIKTAAVLIEGGADLNKGLEGDQSSLHYACRHGYIDIVQLLIEAGAMLNLRTAPEDTGYTPFIIATMNRHSEVMSMLIIEGADIHCKDHLGNTALDIAASKVRIRNPLRTYKKAFSNTSLAAAKLRFARSLVDNTIIPTMAAVNTRTCFGEDRSPSPVDVLLDAALFLKPELGALVFSFLDRHGFVEAADDEDHNHVYVPYIEKDGLGSSSANAISLL